MSIREEEAIETTKRGEVPAFRHGENRDGRRRIHEEYHLKEKNGEHEHLHRVAAQEEPV